MRVKKLFDNFMKVFSLGSEKNDTIFIRKENTVQDCIYCGWKVINMHEEKKSTVSSPGGCHVILHPKLNETYVCYQTTATLFLL
jgi:hypothetical protein